MGTTHFSASADDRTGLSPRHFSTYLYQRYHVSCFHMHIPWHWLGLEMRMEPLNKPIWSRRQLFTHHTGGLEQHEKNHISAPVSMSCQLGTFPDIACTHHTWRGEVFNSLCYICTSIGPTGWTYYIPRPAEDRSCCPRLKINRNLVVMG